MQAEQPTRALAAFLANTGYAELPPEVIERAKDCLLDWIGAAYAGKGSPAEGAIAPLIREMAGRASASLVGAGGSAPPLLAALYNGTISAVAEIDDVHELASLHPGIGVIPAALAVAEERNASGQDLLAALVLGYDAAVRIARAAGPSHYRFWHSTGTCDTFGAAAAAGKLLHLDAEGMSNALGLAGTQAAGLWESITTSAVAAKHLHSGKAASNGILAALLARGGLSGSPTILEGPKGFLAACAEASEQDVEGLTRDLGRPFLILKSFFKKYACCKACIEGIDGIRTLLSQRELHEAEVARVIVSLPPENAWLVGNADPRNAYEAKFSLPFCIALAARTGGASLHHFTAQMTQDPGIRAWMRKIDIRADPRLPVRARIEVECPGRGNFSIEPTIRSLGPEEVREKFADVVRPMLSQRRAGRILAAIDRLEALAGIRGLARLLRRRIACRTE